MVDCADDSIVNCREDNAASCSPAPLLAFLLLRLAWRLLGEAFDLNRIAGTMPAGLRAVRVVGKRASPST